MKNKKAFTYIKKTLLFFIITLTIAFILFFGINLYIDKSAESYIVSLENAPEVDAVIVLGAFVYANGNPSSVLQDRLNYGYNVYMAGKAKKIVVSGDHGTKDYDEVNSMKNYLTQKGVPPEDIFLDHAGFDTYDSMYRAREIFGINTMIISTQQFHINRSIYLARKLGIDAYGYPCVDIYLLKRKYLYFRESFAKIKAFIDADITKRKPKFLGEKIPILGSGILTEG